MGAEAESLAKYIVMKQRGSDHDDLSLAAQMALRRAETAGINGLRGVGASTGHADILKAYYHHKKSALRQHENIEALKAHLPLGEVLVLADWKEQVKYPLGPVQTGGMFFATGRRECSLWGAVVWQHKAESTAENPLIERLFVFFVTNILDHTALCVRQMFDLTLGRARPGFSRLYLCSDCATHFRSASNMYYSLVELPRRLLCPVKQHFLGEKHAKNAADRMFADAQRFGGVGNLIQPRKRRADRGRGRGRRQGVSSSRSEIALSSMP